MLREFDEMHTLDREYFEEMATTAVVALWCEATGVPCRLDDVSKPEDITTISELYKWAFENQTQLRSIWNIRKR